MKHMTSTRVRMSPDSRREQLLTLGVRLFATRSLDDLSIETLAEEAGISRGLLYHYFGNKQEFHTAVVQRAADDLFAVTAPAGDGCPGGPGTLTESTTTPSSPARSAVHPAVCPSLWCAVRTAVRR